jgi:hypothetical protein
MSVLPTYIVMDDGNVVVRMSKSQFRATHLSAHSIRRGQCRSRPSQEWPLPSNRLHDPWVHEAKRNPHGSTRNKRIVRELSRGGCYHASVAPQPPQKDFHLRRKLRGLRLWGQVLIAHTRSWA